MPALQNSKHERRFVYRLKARGINEHESLLEYLEGDQMEIWDSEQNRVISSEEYKRLICLR